MTFFFRVDASTQIGTGHVSRCLSLAHPLKMRGGNVVFLTREHPGHLVGTIRDRGFEVRTLSSGPDHWSGQTLRHSQWLGCDWKFDAEQCVNLLSAEPLNVMIVDHYALDSRWHQLIRPKVSRILAIDDLGDRDLDADLLLDQNILNPPSPKYDGRLPENCVRLEGPTFALLRPQFASLHQSVRARESVGRILVCFGGVDATHETEKALRGVSAVRSHEIRIQVVVSSHYDGRAALESLSKGDARIELYVNPENLEDLLAQADLSLGASGSMMWERACLGLPSITASIATNQVQMGIDGDAAGIHRYLGRSAEIDAAKWTAEVLNLCDQPKLLKAYSVRSLKCTDGRGAERVADRLMQPLVRN